MYDLSSGVEVGMGTSAFRSDPSIECIKARGFNSRIYVYKGMQIAAR